MSRPPTFPSLPENKDTSDFLPLDKISTKKLKDAGTSTNYSSQIPQSTPKEKNKKVTKEAKAMSFVNDALSSSLRAEDIKNKDLAAQENVQRANSKTLQDGEINMFDPDNHKPNTSDLPSYSGLTRTEQEQLLQASDNHQPNSEYGKKSKKFRMLPASTFGKAVLALSLGIGAAIAVGIYQGNQDFNKFQGNTNTVSLATSADIIEVNGTDKIVAQNINLQKVSEDDFNVKRIKSMNISQFNDILLYIDKAATQSIGDSTQNYHLIQFGMEKGQIKPEEGLKLLAASKTSHENFLKSLQNDRDDIIVFFQKAQNGKDVFYKNIDTKSLADEALGRNSASTGIVKTPFEKFQFWKELSVTQAFYKNDANNTVRNKINVALGPLSNNAKTNSYVQMATGVKTDYKSILLDGAGNAKEIPTPNFDINNTKTVPDILSAYKAQVPHFNSQMRQEQIQNAPQYDALAEKALKMVDNFTKKAQDNSQVADSNSNSKPKP